MPIPQAPKSVDYFTDSFITFPKSFGKLRFQIPRGPNFIRTESTNPAANGGTPYSISMLTDDEIDTLCAAMAACMKKRARGK